MRTYRAKPYGVHTIGSSKRERGGNDFLSSEHVRKYTRVYWNGSKLEPGSMERECRGALVRFRVHV